MGTSRQLELVKLHEMIGRFHYRLGGPLFRHTPSGDGGSKQQPKAWNSGGGAGGVLADLRAMGLMDGGEQVGADQGELLQRFQVPQRGPQTRKGASGHTGIHFLGWSAFL